MPKFSALYVVERGVLALTRHGVDGGSIVLQRARAGDVLAEASLYSAAYHCDAIAPDGASVWAIPRDKLAALLRDDPDLSELWAAHLAGAVQAARFRSEVLSLKTVADRLDAWAAWHDGVLPPKGEWKALADQIAVSPEALYREMARRRAP